MVEQPGGIRVGRIVPQPLLHDASRRVNSDIRLTKGRIPVKAGLVRGRSRSDQGVWPLLVAR